MGTFTIDPTSGKPREMQQQLCQDGTSRRPPVLIMRTDANQVAGGG